MGGLPMCILAGEHDFAKFDEFGVPSHERIRAEMASWGKATPKVIVYPGARHELMKELNRAEVMEDMVRFLCACDGRQAYITRTNAWRNVCRYSFFVSCGPGGATAGFLRNATSVHDWPEA